MKVYTKTGDKGETSLLGGKRVSKSHDYLHVYGLLDKLNAQLGLVVTQAKKNSKLLRIEPVSILLDIQSKLFQLGSVCATEELDREKFKLKRMSAQEVTFLEDRIDLIDQKLPKLTNFILPGGCEEAALLHICRTTTRDIERAMTKILSQDATYLNQYEQQYINRLSDYFFCEARNYNYVMEINEVLWNG